MRRLLLLVCGARLGGHDALRGAHAAPPPLRGVAPPVEDGGRRARRRVRGRRARRRAAGRSGGRAARLAASRPRRPDADGPREPRLRVRPRLLGARRRALPAGLRQRVHVGRRVRVAARRDSARAPRRDDRERDGRSGVRRALRAGGRSGRRARRASAGLHRARRARGRARRRRRCCLEPVPPERAVSRGDGDARSATASSSAGSR